MAVRNNRDYNTIRDWEIKYVEKDDPENRIEGSVVLDPSIIEGSTVYSPNIGKITEGKLNYELDWEILTLLAERMQKGKEKYKPYSWKNPTNIEDLKQALFRHTLEILKGNYEDDGQEYGHLGAILANCMILHYQIKNGSKTIPTSS